MVPAGSMTCAVISGQFGLSIGVGDRAALAPWRFGWPDHKAVGGAHDGAIFQQDTLHVGCSVGPDPGPVGYRRLRGFRAALLQTTQPGCRPDCLNPDLACHHDPLQVRPDKSGFCRAISSDPSNFGGSALDLRRHPPGGCRRRAAAGGSGEHHVAQDGAVLCAKQGTRT